jgi:hypothetical protein
MVCQKYGKTKEAKDDNLAKAHYMLDNYDYKHTRIIQGDQKVSVHLMITKQSSGAQRLFDHLACNNVFPLQQWFQERASMLRSTYTVLIKQALRPTVLPSDRRYTATPIICC